MDKQQQIQLVLDTVMKQAKVNDVQSLINFAGWGSYADELSKNLDIPPEHLSQIMTVLNTSYYTRPEYVKFMWEVIENKFGFKGGNALEPAIGNGRFLYYRPPHLQNRTKWVGVDKDPFATYVSSQIFPNTTIYNRGLENLDIGKEKFELIMTNVPFGDITIKDAVSCEKMKIHDYFIIRCARALADRGVLAVVTSTGFMDREETAIRKMLIQEHIKLVFAFRVPNIAEGTGVTSDILFFQRANISSDEKGAKKKEDAINTALQKYHTYLFSRTDNQMVSAFLHEKGGSISQSFLSHLEVQDYIQTKNDLYMNQYFWNNPTHVIGTIVPNTAYDLDYKRIQLKSNLSVNQVCEKLSSIIKENESEGEAIPQNKETRLYLPANKLDTADQYYNEGDRYYEIKGIFLETCNNVKVIKVKSFHKLHNAYIECVEANMRDEQDLTPYQEKLKKAYFSFIKHNSYINSRSNLQFFTGVADFEVLRGLEAASTHCHYDKKDFPDVAKEENHYKLAAIFTQKVFSNNEIRLGSIENLDDALFLSLNIKGEVDLDYIAELTGKDLDTLKQQLIPDYIFYDYQLEKHLSRDEYLSGNIAEKLEYLEKLSAIEEDGNVHPEQEQINQNMMALLSVLPPVVLPPLECPFYEEIKTFYEENGRTVLKDGTNTLEIVNMGVTPTNLIEDFTRQFVKYNVKITKLHGGGYSIDKVSSLSYESSSLMENRWGIPDRPYFKLLGDLLNNKPSIVRGLTDENGDVLKGDKGIDPQATLLAQEKREAIFKAFVDWVWQDYYRAGTVIKHYNRHHNSYIHREYNGEKLELRCYANKSIQLRSHQKNGVWRIMQSKSTLLAWEVGAGKTFTMIAACQELKRLNLVKRPMVVVPNATLEQFRREYQQLYPLAKLLIISSNQLDEKELLISSINTQDWDCILISDSVFDNNISISPQYVKSFYEDHIAKLTEQEDALKVDKNISKGTLKKASAQLSRYATEMNKLLTDVNTGASTKTREIFLDALGVDMLVIDEAHNYKNLPFYTQLDVKGLNAGTYSKRSVGTLLKVHSILNNGGKVVFSTATPIANTVAELWTMQRYLIPDELTKSGFYAFDNWINAFGVISAKSEIHHVRGMVTTTRIRRYTNRSEMLKLAFQCIDVINAKFLKDNNILEVPEAIVVNEISPLSDTQQDYMKYLVLRAVELEGKMPEKGGDNHLTILTDGRKCVLDERLVTSKGINNLESKVNQVIYNTYRIWKATTPLKATQLLFCDESVPDGKRKFNIYAYVKMALVNLGIPESEIAFIHDFDSEDARKKAVLKNTLSTKVNEGDIRIVLGSTQKLGTGTNVQRRICALHHLSIKYRPMDLDQRNGRAIRQGNLFKKVALFYYVAKGVNESSLDSFLWQIIRTKQEFIATALIDDGHRSIAEPQFDDSDEKLPASTLISIALGNPELRELNNKRQELDMLLARRNAFLSKNNHSSKELNRLIRDIDSDSYFLERIKGLKEMLLHLYTTNETIKLCDQQFNWQMDAKELDKIKSKVSKSLSVMKANVRAGTRVLFQYDELTLQVNFFPDSGNQYLLRYEEKGILIALSDMFRGAELIHKVSKKVEDTAEKIKTDQYAFKLLSEADSQTEFPEEAKLNILQKEVDALMEKFGDDLDLDLNELEIPMLDTFQSDKLNKTTQVNELTPLTAEEISAMHDLISIAPEWYPQLDDIINSWQGEDQTMVQQALELEEQYQLEIELEIEWEKELQRLFTVHPPRLNPKPVDWDNLLAEETVTTTPPAQSKQTPVAKKEKTKSSLTKKEQQLLSIVTPHKKGNNNPDEPFFGGLLD